MATALTYRTGNAASKLRTVVVDDVRHSVVLLPTGSLDVVMAKLLHGTTCAHGFWDEVLDTEGDDFAIPASQVVKRREIQVAVKAHPKGGSAIAAELLARLVARQAEKNQPELEAC